MKEIALGNCSLKFNKEQLVQFLKHNYDENYQSERFKHSGQNDFRLPRLKITDDIVSFSLCFKDKSGEEWHLKFDGEVFTDYLSFHSITFSGEYVSFEASNLACDTIINKLKNLSKLCLEDNFILFSINDQPYYLKNGEKYNFQYMLSQIFNGLHFEEKQKLEPIYEWILECNKFQNKKSF